MEHATIADGYTTIDHEGVDQTVLLSSEDMMLVHYAIEPGVESETHSHPHQQLGYVVGGEGRQIIDGTEYDIGPGTCYRIDPGETHSMQSVGSEPLELIDVFSPIREDYRAEHALSSDANDR